MSRIQKEAFDWSGCPIIQREPGKLGGAWNIRGQRITPETILVNYEEGMSFAEIQEQFPSVTTQDMETIVEYAEAHGLLVYDVA